MRLPLLQLAERDRHPAHIAEVIETATTEFLAQCLEPEDLSFPAMPPFGSWVKSFDEEANNQIYGVVYHATTSPIDSVHRARALGMSLEDLRQQQPQILNFGLRSSGLRQLMGRGAAISICHRDHPRYIRQYIGVNQMR